MSNTLFNYFKKEPNLKANLKNEEIDKICSKPQGEPECEKENFSPVRKELTVKRAVNEINLSNKRKRIMVLSDSDSEKEIDKIEIQKRSNKIKRIDSESDIESDEKLQILDVKG
jgi:coenzyme F420-reducing hydrogenase delta subunit